MQKCNSLRQSCPRLGVGEPGTLNLEGKQSWVESQFRGEIVKTCHEKPFTR